jgi:hypothetical protein
LETGLTATTNVSVAASGLTPFEAMTLKLKLVVPLGGIPETMPVAGPMDSHAGAAPSANAGVGSPLAATYV